MRYSSNLQFYKELLEHRWLIVIFRNIVLHRFFYLGTKANVPHPPYLSQGCLSLEFLLRRKFFRILGFIMQPVMIHLGAPSVCSVFTLPCRHCLIPSRGRLSGVSGRSSLSPIKRTRRRARSTLLGNYENPVTGFKWRSAANVLAAL